MDLTLVFLRLSVLYVFGAGVLVTGAYLCYSFPGLLASKRRAYRILLIALNVTITGNYRVSVRVVRRLENYVFVSRFSLSFPREVTRRRLFHGRP